MSENVLVTGFELKLPRCANTYGESPCTAEVGVTGDFKCYNTGETCQVPADYVDGDVQVLRFVESNSLYQQSDYILIPSIKKNGISVSPMKIRPAEDTGERESATITLSNHKDNDFVLDPYLDDRGYEPYLIGYSDFLSRFDERYPNVQGYECSIVRGNITQSWDEMERSHYIVEKGVLSGDMTNYVISVKDIFSLMQNKKAQLPRPCDGFLVADMGTGTGDFTVGPTGIGAVQYPDGMDMYPASGYVFIGEEIIKFNRSADVFSVIERGALNTPITEHSEGDSVQTVAHFESMTSAEILEKILTFTEIDTSWNNMTLWEEEVSNYDERLYTGYVCEPTEVSKIVDELMKDVCLSIYPDIVAKKIVFEYMRVRGSSFQFNDENMFNISRGKNYEKRISSVYIKFGRYNALKKMDENTNFLGRLYRLGEDQNAVLQRNTNVVYNLNSRFIPMSLRDAADENSKVRLSRYSKPPRLLSFGVDKSMKPKIGAICDIQSRFIKDFRGFSTPVVKFQIVSILESNGRFLLNAEEYNFTDAIPLPDPTLHVINIIVDQFNVNLRELHDSIYTSIESGDTVKLIIDPGIKIGSNTYDSTTEKWLPALNVGSWPSGVTIEIHFMSTTSGIHGRGGDGGAWGFEGNDAGDAIYTRYAIELIGIGRVWGGGGGGGGVFYAFLDGTVYRASGGAGAGYIAGSGYGTPNLEDGGIGEDSGGATGGTGGGAGQPGEPSNFSVAGGDAGNAVDGHSYVTYNSQDVRGPQIN